MAAGRIRRAVRQSVRQVHLWMGLTIGLLFALAGLTGSILVFYPEIDAVLHPEIRVDHRATPDWDTAIQTVRSAFPDKAGAWRFEVTDAGGAIPARYYNPPETRHRAFAPMMVWLSPDGGEVLRRDYWGDYAVTWIYDLHYQLQAGKIGAQIFGYAGIAMVVLLITGIWAWWPRGGWGKAVRWKAAASPLRRLHDLHKLTGLWSMALLLILAVTGVMLALPSESDVVLAATVAPVDKLPRPTSSSDHGRPIGAERAIAAAKQGLPDARIAWIEVPGPGDGAWRFRMQQPGDPSRRFPHSFVWVDQYDGRVLAVADSRRASTSTTINNWTHPLHDGSAAGLGGRVLAALAGFAPVILCVTGLLRWYRRRQARTAVIR